MKLLRNLYFSFPIQLLLLHFRKFQVLLLFWFILFSTVSGHFMKSYGANALFLAPEYLGSVNVAGAAILGGAIGVFIMSWHITTFILHSKRYRFLATTSKPFLKYCINNSIIPLIFLVVYFLQAAEFDLYKELMSTSEFIVAAAGFFGGLILLIAFSFAYFFTADKRIVSRLRPLAKDEYISRKTRNEKHPLQNNYSIRVKFFLADNLVIKRARKVGHYGEEFLDHIFKRHHFAAIWSVVLAFIFMILIGFFLDHRIFQIPAAASITIFFALMIAVIGALTYFLQTWSVLFLLLFYICLDVLYRFDVIDPRNKAYGLNYDKKTARPAYDRSTLQALCSLQKVKADEQLMLEVLNNWKKRQLAERPVIVFMNFSGGGVRSASFAMNTLQQLDSLTEGKILKQTFLMSGASGGMLSAAYFRELYRMRNADNT
ncbi:MAG: hypothetical protein ABIR81_10235, partial [Ginsengibacter sp.]